MGASGILADHQLKAELEERHIKGQSDLTISDIARKAFLYSHFLEGHAKTAPISRLPLITIVDPKNQLKDIPVCQPFHLELNFFNKENRVLHYPVRAFYVDGVNLMAYNLSSGGDSIYKKLFASIPGNVEYYPKRMVYGKKRHLFLIVYEFSGTTNEVVLYWENTDIKLANSKGNTVKGCDAAFIGPNENQFAILDEDKSGLALYVLPGVALQEAGDKNGAVEPNLLPDQPVEANTNSIQGPMPFLFETEIDRIFSTPIESTLMFACNGKQIGLAKLVQSYVHPSSDGHYISTKTEGKKFIRLKANEIVLQVHWQETPRGYVAGVLTTHRVLMVSADLDVLASICILGWDGKVRTVLSISMPNAALLGALNDRLLLANPTDINPRQKKGVEIKSCLVGLLEPLLIGFSTMQQNFEQKLDLSEILYQITSRFDSLRITPRSLDILARGPPVCGDLAVSLSQAGPQFTQVLRGQYAIKALRFSTALSVLKDEFVRSRDYPKCPPTSHLFHQFRQLGYACIKYGQFDSAKETFEVIADYESMLDLFLCHLNPSAMRRLAQRLEEEGADSELRRYCERILRVRSSGWTQGIFANFAAESMVPKGLEWGGGNWEIKTPTNLKSIPQWELAAEVMPYMKTDDGAIPSIITDHIGVYLGSIKGRGNIVKVKEGSLVIPAVGDSKPNGAGTSIPESADSYKGFPVVETKAGSLMGLETLIKPNQSSTATDEQAKAAEEFKKTMYGTADDGSSSDEEGVSKTKKLQIRIRDKPTSGAVDVNKIKEATKRLGDGLGLPIARTKSLTGISQDLGQSQQQPYPATSTSVTNPTVSAAGDLFGTDSWVQPALASQSAPATKGVGTAAGPIPEDFFQNTIPSLQVAASLPNPGTYHSKLDQTSQKVEAGGKVPPAHVTAPAADIGLPAGGVPPQFAEQPIPPESFALPDGGVPPQYTAAPAGMPQPQVQPSQMPLSTQPLDLSALGVPIPPESGKPTSSEPAPASVRPGQVPRGAAAAICFKTGLAHLEQNQLSDSLSCFDEAFLALAKDNSRGADIKAQATICAQYKIAVTLLQEILRLQKVQGPRALSAKDEMARLSRHLGSLPLQAKHRINCIRTAIKRNMDVQNYAYAKQMLELLLSKAPTGKQEELRSLIDICVQRGLTNKSIDPLEDPSQFCAATLSRLSTIGYDVCDLCGAKFSALSSPGCIICGMGSIKRSDALGGSGPVASPFG
ncbi:estradiol 17-beta-dehydrogenase 1-like [Hibiscus syriacus]|uniref:Estradiol 17-beta-dehydrogenase 1-like n=1 Tax=Hibiscus syriacus TaxID=106335 RepID=A0A6A3C6Z9_HIBSY|nr:estradiol 17-beta-dehydrogenase 1-like [Hibiscus syriacus]